MFEVIKCAHERILSQCVFIFIQVNMGLALSIHRIDFYRCRLIARTIVVPSNEIASLKDEFSDLPGSMLDKLKALYSEVFTEVNWGRLLIFLNFAEQLGLTVEEWNRLYDFLLPTLNRIIE